MAFRSKKLSRTAVDVLELMKELGAIVQARIREQIPVKRGELRKGIHVLANRQRVIIFSWHYWARIVNDGRGAIQLPELPDRVRPLIWFKDPSKDPRIRSGYPKRRSQIKRLTRRQFRYHRKQGNLIITDYSGPVKALRFYEKGLQAARKEIPETVMDRIKQDVRRNITRGRGGVKDRITVVL